MLKTARKGGYTTLVHTIYGIPPPPLEENHGSIYTINTIVQWIQNQSDDTEELAQANVVLTGKKSVMMAQLVQMTATMNVMQAKLKTLSAASINSTRPRRKYYCWI